MSKTLSQREFGANVAHYFSSKPHASGRSLDRLIELTDPKPEWHMLDIATGGGHVAYSFAPRVARVWATDVTDEMLRFVREETVRRQLGNVRLAFAQAEALPFEDGIFDLVTCRIAPHHFESIDVFLDEARRVLKPSGRFALVDNMVPDGVVGTYINALDRLRDPSHRRALSLDGWRAALQAHRFVILHEEQLSKRIEFASWASRHDAWMRSLLEALIVETSPSVAAYLDARSQEGGLYFRQDEALFIAGGS